MQMKKALQSAVSFCLRVRILLCMTPHSPGEGLGLSPTVRFRDIVDIPVSPSITKAQSLPHSVASPSELPDRSDLKSAILWRSSIHCLPSGFAIPDRMSA